MRKLVSLVFIFSLVPILSFAQKGKHGSKTVSGVEIVNEYTDLTADASAGDVTISVTNSSLNTNARFLNSLEAGDLLMVIQVQGASIRSTTRKDTTWGEITNYNNCGNNEYVEVAAVPNGTSISLTCALVNNYTAAGEVVVVRVPRFTDLVLQPGDTIRGDSWDGSIGGIVAVEIEGDLFHDGVIEMNGKGFRGTGSTTGQGNVAGAKNEFASSDPSAAGLKGEGIAGYHALYDTKKGRFGQGAAANAGGGGCSTDAGGGGGANAGDITKYTGHGVPSLLDPNWATAWELEAVGFSTKTSSGGGRGGYSRCGAGLNPLTNGPNNYATWKGDGRRETAIGLGGRPLDYSTGKLFLGGGGGQGHGSDRDASAGANGGGLIYLKVSGDIIGNGNIESIGAIGESNQNASGFSSAIDGAGGGGAGGTIVIDASGTISAVNISAIGGKGGSVTQTSFANSGEANGPGGGGGGGYVKVSAAGAVIDVSGGRNGDMNSAPMSSFLPNGATDGGVGVFEIAAISEPSLTITHDTICIGGTANLAVVGNNLPGGAVITWYDKFTNGSVLTTGTNYSDAGITTDTMFFVEVCPGNIKDTVFVKIDIAPNATVTNDTVYACENVDVQMEAQGGVSYSWWPTTGLNASNIANPIANISSSQMYYVEVSNAGGCTDTDSVYVSVSASLVVNLGSDLTICKGDTATLSATGGTIYTWTPTADILTLGLPTVKVFPADTMKYYVTVDDGSGCTGTDSIVVNVLPAIQVISPGNQDLCKDELVNLSLSSSGGSGGSVTYSWDDGTYVGANQSLSWGASTTMEVKATDDTYGCSDSITMLINIRTFDLDFSYSDTCFNTPTNFVATATLSGTPVSYDWKYYSTNTGTGASDSYQYPVTGVQSVKLLVTDDLGCIDSVEKTITIQPLPNNTIVMAPDTVCVNDSIVYTSNYNNVAGSTSDWDFGDGNSSSDGSGSHIYTVVGQFFVTLEVSDLNGCSNSVEDSVLVEAGPDADFTIPADGKLGETVSLVNTTIGGQIYEWKLLENTFSTTEHTTLLLDTASTICVELVTTSQAGCKDSIEHCIDVLGEELEIPNIFTPNEDGQNDQLILANSVGRTVNIQVLNRWGRIVYEANDYQNDWKGTDSNGKELVEGTYFYVVTDVTSDTPIQLNGFIAIQR